MCDAVSSVVLKINVAFLMKNEHQQKEQEGAKRNERISFMYAASRQLHVDPLDEIAPVADHRHQHRPSL